MAIESYFAFESGTELATALSGEVALSLADRLEKSGQATLAVSGGTTPKLFLETLSQQTITWADVTVTLVDDRCVAPDHERSNERFVQETLLQNKAALARFQPVVASDRPQEAVQSTDVLVLGMGQDGHTASLFPNGDNLEVALSDDVDSRYVLMSAPGAEEPRVTMTLPAIVSAGRLFLHIEGQEKADVLERARTDPDLPIHHILRHPNANLSVYWAP